MSNEQLVLRIKAGENTADNMLELYNKNIGLIRYIALKFKNYVDIDDLMQQGYLGLCQAVDSYDCDKGAKFSTIAYFYIFKSISRYVKGNVTRAVSLDAPIGGEGKEAITLADTVSSGSNMENNILDKVFKEGLKAVIWHEVGELEDRKAQVIYDRYKANMTYKAIAEHLGISEAKVITAHASALDELRHSHVRKLKPFYIEYIETHGYRHNGVGSFQRTWTSSTEYCALKLIDLEC